MRVGSLFSGIGGFDYGFENAGMRVVWQSEIEPFACAVLRKHWPHVPNHGDVRSIRGHAVGTVDVICGGFPCQDISLAGKGAGIDGERSGLWAEYARIVRECRPEWVVAENVPALRTRGYDRVHDDLEAAGYTAEAFVVGADDIGAPHRRKRVWIVAHSYARRRQQQRRGGLLDRERPALGHDANRCSGARDAAGAAVARLAQWESERQDARAELAALVRSYRRTWGCAPQPTVRRVDDGISAGLVRHRRPALAALGNALLPQIAEAIGRVILTVENHGLP